MKRRAIFIERLGAFLIDIIIISLIANIIATVFVNQDNINKLSEQEITLLNDYKDNKIDVNTFTEEASSISYESSKLLIPYTIIYICLSIGYYVIFQQKNGQTLGKKLLKIKIKSDKGKLTINQMVIRSLIINAIFFNIIDLAAILFLSKGMYMNAYFSIKIVEYILFIVIAFMVMFRKDKCGLHDIVCHTKVVSVK